VSLTVFSSALVAAVVVTILVVIVVAVLVILVVLIIAVVVAILVVIVVAVLVVHEAHLLSHYCVRVYCCPFDEKYTCWRIKPNF